MRKLFVLVAMLLLTTTSFAGYYTGNDLKKWSEASDRISQGRSRDGDYQESAIFTGFVTGVADAVQGDFICVPVGTSVRQLKAMVDKFMNENPATWGKDASLLVMYALTPDFPCKK
jgi:hypothetical protein